MRPVQQSGSEITEIEIAHTAWKRCQNESSKLSPNNLIIINIKMNYQFFEH